MQDSDDLALLREYATNNSETAFEELVSRRVGFVYSSALRQARDPHLAGEITQAVFIILAQKAGRISDKTVLTGWLFKTTRFAALAQMRAAAKLQRQKKEFQMQTEFQSAATDELWNQMSPLLDEALATLGESDRQAVLLRFFENKSLAEVGNYLGAGEDTARKRVARALEKLRKFFTKRGVNLTTAIIAGTISANSVQAAPVALAKSVAAVAIAKGAAASGSTLTLIKGALKIMAWSKVKIAAWVLIATILATGTATIAVKTYFFPKIKDFYFQPNYRQFQRLPSGLFVLRPTHFRTPAGGIDYSAETSSKSGEHVTLMMGRNRSFVQLIARVYNCSPDQIVLPPITPKDNFDYLSTVLDGRAQERMQEAIKKQLGYVANWKEYGTNTPVQMLVVEKTQ